MNTLVLDAAGPQIATEDDIRDIVGEAAFGSVDLVVIPSERLAPDFFRLSSGFAGIALQKFTNYRLRVAIVGDISAYIAKSAPQRAFVAEGNRRGEVRFVDSMADL